MKPKIILTHPFTPLQVEWLKARVDLVLADDYPDLHQAAEAHSDAVGLISFLSDPVDGALLERLPNLRIVANYAVGYNNIHVARAVERGIWVTHTPDVLTDATADLTMTLLLAACRRLIEADQYVRQGQFKGWGATLMLGRELTGAVLGIVGLGRIGGAVARRARAFGLRVLYTANSDKPELERELGLERVDFDQLLSQSDIISLHLPYSKAVHHLFDASTFARMKPDSIFINVARGGLMDEAALVEAVKSGHLFAAGLDVFEAEPTVHPGVLACQRIVVAPHIGSATHQTRERMAMMVAEDVLRVCQGEVPRYPVLECRKSGPAGPVQ
jgi:glyoxylate reductase